MEDAQAVAMLVRRCIAGDAVAWEEIVQRYNRRIYNICYRFAGSADDAQDLTQEVFIKMYRMMSSYDSGRAAFMTWVTTITRNLLVDHFRKLALPNLTVVSPDAGGVERARFFAKKVDAALAIVDKRRVEMNVAEIMNVIGDVHGRTCLIIDDLIDTAGTLVKTAAALIENGATSVYACASHAVLSGPAVENIRNSVIKEVVVTNTIPLTAEAEAARTEKGGKIHVLSIAGLIGRAIQANHEETSVSKLFM